ncbi:hypothetical protein HY635_02460 [Candidatus Uhrbacteria bacterium]|nr:hypothetical protein [Candidatus Uhrbacteria bacterium]
MRFLRILAATSIMTIALVHAAPVAFADESTFKNPETGSLAGRVKRTAGAAGFDQGTDEYRFARIIGGIIKYATTLIGVILVAQMVYAGYLWMTASGEEEQITKAKHIIRRSIIGLAIVLSAWAISLAVLLRITNATGGA